MRGVLHVHSVFSDGEESLERIVQTFRDAGMHFLAVSDHAEIFDDERMRQYVALCASVSNGQFLVIPGLEFAEPEINSRAESPSPNSRERPEAADATSVPYSRL